MHRYFDDIVKNEQEDAKQFGPTLRVEHTKVVKRENHRWQWMLTLLANHA